MRTKLLASLGAALLLALAVSSASANSLRTSSQTFDVTWTPLTFSAGGANINCNVTLRGSFSAATIAKTAGRKGAITGAALSNCSGGTATVLTETLPWSVNYVSFSGTLPRISGVRVALIGAAFSVDPSGILPNCLVGTTVGDEAFGTITISGGTATGLRADETTGIDLGGSFICEIAGEGFFAGTGAVTNGSGSAITVTLI